MRRAAALGGLEALIDRTVQSLRRGVLASLEGGGALMRPPPSGNAWRRFATPCGAQMRFHQLLLGAVPTRVSILLLISLGLGVSSAAYQALVRFLSR